MRIIEHIETNETGPKVLWRWLIFELKDEGFEKQLEEANHFIKIWAVGKLKNLLKNTIEINISYGKLIIKQAFEIN